MECKHQIIIVGIGPGSPDYLLPIASRTIGEASVLVGSKRALDTFAAKEQLTKIIDKDIKGVLEFIQCQLTTQDVVIMVSGDPGFYSMLAAIRQQFSAECIRVIPGISSAQLAFARLAEAWQDATLLSMHGRQAEDGLLTYQPNRKLGILTDSQHNPAYIARVLRKHGWPNSTQVWLCANLSYDNEKVSAMTLAEAVNIVGFEHSVMVVKA